MKGISKRDFESFTKKMWNRLKEGEKKYGCEYKESDIAKSMSEEAQDLANYSFMLYLKAKKFQQKYVK